jgi:hypothetical protein
LHSGHIHGPEKQDRKRGASAVSRMKGRSLRSHHPPSGVSPNRLGSLFGKYRSDCISRQRIAARLTFPGSTYAYLKPRSSALQLRHRASATHHSRRYRRVTACSARSLSQNWTCRHFTALAHLISLGPAECALLAINALPSISESILNHLGGERQT